MPAPPRKLIFALPASQKDSADQYRDAFNDMFEADVDPAGFHCKSAKIHLGSAILSHASMAGQVFRRTRPLTRKNDVDSIQIICDAAGTWSGDYDGKSASGRPGTVRFVDLSRPFVNNTTSFETFGLIIPRKALGKEVANLDLHGLVLPETSASTWLLAAHIRTVWKAADTLTPAEALIAAEAAGILASGAINGMISVTSDTMKPIERTLFSVARDYIDAHLADLTLTPAKICQHLGVSARTLYRIFEEAGGVSSYIQSRRLDTSYHAISCAENGKVPLAEIAYAHGFQSNAHFSRAFAARFGMPPGELRRQGIAGTAKPAPNPTFGSVFVDWCRNL
jgi:AraC-like DNA-binding protein